MKVIDDLSKEIGIEVPLKEHEAQIVISAIKKTLDNSPLKLPQMIRVFLEIGVFRGISEVMLSRKKNEKTI